MASGDDAAAMPPPRQERSLASLFAALARESSRLVRQEIALAKAELLDKLGKIGTGTIEIVVGALLAYAGVLALLAAAILGLARVVPNWAAALIVGGVAVLVGVAFILRGRRNVEPRNLVPDRTLRSLRDDAEWARKQMQ